MKKNTKKISLLTLAAIGTMTLGFGVSALNAKADDALTTIAMAPGASVRLGATDGENTYNGIRFVAELGNYSEANDYSYGMIIVPFDYVTTYADAIAAFDGDIIAAAQAGGIEFVNLKCLPVFGDGDMDGDEEWFIQGSLVEILPENLNRKFVGIGYFHDGSAYTYAAINEADNARSISYVASKVIHGYTNDVASETDPYDVCLNYAYGGIGGSEFAITADASVELFVGASKKLTVAQAPAMDYFVAFESANNAVATVSADGTVTAVGAGETKILVKCVDKVVEVPVTVAYDWANINYDFSSANDVDATAVVTTHSNVVINGMVEDTAASDGWAFKFINPTNSHVGVKVLFNDLDTSKYQSIKLRLKSVNPSFGHSSVYVNGDNSNGTSAHWGLTNGYLDIDILSKAGDKLSCVYIGIDGRPNTEFYIDGFTFVEKPDYSKYNYDFSSATDNDLDVVSVTNTGAVNFAGIVADAAASDGFALKFTKTSSANEGVIISFGDIDTSLYSQITLRIRTEGNVGGVYVNGKGGACSFWNQAAVYTDVDIRTHANGTLSSVYVGIDRNSTVFYVDSITFVEMKSYDYSFSSADDIDLEMVSITNSGAINFAGIVADADATDGFALKFTKTSAAKEGIIINLGNLDKSLYSSITLRIKTEGNVGGVYHDSWSGKCPFWQQSNSYVDVDLLKNASDTLSSIYVGIDKNSTVFYIDCITFVLK